MRAYDLGHLVEERGRSDRLYLEFLREPSLSVGVYELAAGSIDPQQPHTEDEVYFVVRGRGRIQVGEEDQAVASGMIVFVAAGVDHKFHTIQEDLTILVFFVPAEYSLRSES